MKLANPCILGVIPNHPEIITNVFTAQMQSDCAMVCVIP